MSTITFHVLTLFLVSPKCWALHTAGVCAACLGGRGQEKGEDSSLYVKANQQPSNHILKGVCVFVGVCAPGITEADIIPSVIQKM